MISTGGDYDSTLGQAVPGFSIFHYGLDLIAVVSTGEDVWELKVTTQIICEDLRRRYCYLLVIGARPSHQQDLAEHWLEMDPAQPGRDDHLVPRGERRPGDVCQPGEGQCLLLKH